MPVRKVSNWGDNIIGSFPSLKNGQAVQYESTIERDLLFFLEYDSTVIRYEMQPLIITGMDSTGKTRTYTPDVLVTRKTGRELVECKPAALVNDARTQQQIALGQGWAETNNCDFVVVTDVDLRTGPRLANLKILWRYARFLVSQNIIEACRTLLAMHTDGVKFSDLVSLLDDHATKSALHASLYHLMFWRIITTDLYQPLSTNSVVTLAVS